MYYVLCIDERLNSTIKTFECNILFVICFINKLYANGDTGCDQCNILMLQGMQRERVEMSKREQDAPYVSPPLRNVSSQKRSNEGRDTLIGQK